MPGDFHPDWIRGGRRGEGRIPEYVPDCNEKSLNGPWMPDIFPMEMAKYRAKRFPRLLYVAIRHYAEEVLAVLDEDGEYTIPVRLVANKLQVSLTTAFRMMDFIRENREMVQQAVSSNEWREVEQKLAGTLQDISYLDSYQSALKMIEEGVPPRENIAEKDQRKAKKRKGHKTPKRVANDSDGTPDTPETETKPKSEETGKVPPESESEAEEGRGTSTASLAAMQEVYTTPFDKPSTGLKFTSSRISM